MTAVSKIKFALIMPVFLLHIIGIPVTAQPQTEEGLLSAEDITHWQEDLDSLAEELPKRHKNLFFQLPEDKFREDIRIIKQNLPNMSQAEVIVDLMKIIASVGDSHSTLRFSSERILPLKFFWFQDGIYLIQTTKEYQDLLHHKLIAIENTGIDEIIRMFTSIIPHENQAQIEHRLPNMLFYTELLYGLHIIPDMQQARITLENSQGQPYSMIIRSIPIKENPEPVSLLNSSKLPLYMKNFRDNYWFEYLEEEESIYFQYNRCRNMPDRPIREFTDNLINEIEKRQIRRLIIDLRQNGGGSSVLLMKFINHLKNNPKINQEGKLYVVVGRATFSSAILNAISLRNSTQAVFVGEPTGGKPNHFGEVQGFKLNHSGYVVSFSTKYFTHSKEDTPSFMPDIQVKISITDYSDHRDPVLDKIFSLR